jgi:hypothetical protein
MDVEIKKLQVEMAVKSSGLELEIRKPNGGKHLGDCYVTMTGLVWCKGKTSKTNGVRIDWDTLIEILGSKEAVRTAIAAVRAT